MRIIYRGIFHTPLLDRAVQFIKVRIVCFMFKKILAAVNVCLSYIISSSLEIKHGVIFMSLAVVNGVFYVTVILVNL